MSVPRHTPVDIGASEDGARVRIEWKDGHTSEFEPRYLRLRCPCAGCVEELTGRPMLVPEMVPRNIHLLEIHHVGRYALRFVWSDGHRTGIYSFEYLRRLDRPGRA